MAAVFFAGAFFAGALAAVAAFFADAVFFAAVAVAFLAGALAAFFAALAVVVFRALRAATVREVVGGTSTEMPRLLRWASSALRWRGSIAASSLAWRTSSGLNDPVGAPRSMSATTAGWAKTSAGAILRGFEDTNTSRQEHGGAARPGNVKSRAGHSATGTKRTPNSPRHRRPDHPRAAAFFCFL